MFSFRNLVFRASNKSSKALLAGLVVFGALTSISLSFLASKPAMAAIENQAVCEANGGIWQPVPVPGLSAGSCINQAGGPVSSKGDEIFKTADGQIKSYIYSLALGKCIKDGGLGLTNVFNALPTPPYPPDIGGSSLRFIPHDAAGTGAWFSPGTGVFVSGYMRGAEGGGFSYAIRDSEHGGGAVYCDRADYDLVHKALNLWGYNTAESRAKLLCDMGFRRHLLPGVSNCSSLINQTDDIAGPWVWPGSSEPNKEEIYNKFRSIIVNRIYGGDFTKVSINTEPMRYAYLRGVFQKTCLQGNQSDLPASIDRSIAQGHATWSTNGYEIIDVQSTHIEQELDLADIPRLYYIGNLPHSERISLHVLSPPSNYAGASNIERSDVIRCDELAAEINGLAGAYRAWLAENPEGGTSAVSPIDDFSGENSTTCPVEGGLGWLICPLMATATNASDFMYRQVQNILEIDPVTTHDDTGAETYAYTTWKRIRDIANVLLVIMFLIIIFSQLTSVGIDNYGIKKMLPRIILVAIAINLSFFAMMLMIDVFNIVGRSLGDILGGLAPAAEPRGGTDGAPVGGTILVVGGIAVIAAGFSGNALGALVLMALPFILLAALSIIAAFATLFVRNALVILLAIVAPLAFAAYLLPNTEEWFKKWRKLFISMLVLYPMAAVLFAGSQAVAKVVANTASDDTANLSGLIAVFIMAAPLGMLPWLAKSSGGILGGLSSKLQGMAKKANDPFKKYMGRKADVQRAKYKAGESSFSGFNGRRFRARQEAGRTTMGQRGEARRALDEQKVKDFAQTGDNKMKELALNPETGGRRRDRRLGGALAASDRYRHEGHEEHEALESEAKERQLLEDSRGRLGEVEYNRRLNDLNERIANKHELTARRLRSQGAVKRLEQEELGEIKTNAAPGALGGGAFSADAIATMGAESEVSRVDTQDKTAFEQSGEGQTLKIEHGAAEAELKAAQDKTAQLQKELTTDAGRVAMEASDRPEEEKARLGLASNDLQSAAEASADATFATGIADRKATSERSDAIVSGRKEAPETIGGEAAVVQYQAQAQEQKSKLFGEAVQRQMTLDEQPNRFVVSYTIGPTGEKVPTKVIPGAPKGSDHVDRLRAYAKDPVGSGLTPEQVFASIKALGEMGGGTDINDLYIELLPQFNVDSPLVTGGYLGEDPTSAQELAADIRASIQQTISRKGSVMAFGGPRVAHALDGKGTPELEFLEYAATDPNFGAAAMANGAYHSSGKQFLLKTLQDYQPKNEYEEALLERARWKVKNSVIPDIDKVPQYEADTSAYRAGLEGVAAKAPATEPPAKLPPKPS